MENPQENEPSINREAIRLEIFLPGGATIKIEGKSIVACDPVNLMALVKTEEGNLRHYSGFPLIVETKEYKVVFANPLDPSFLRRPSM